MPANNDKIFISIANDFSRTPGPRYIEEGGFSGELFRKKILGPKFAEAIEQKKKIFIDLDGTAGYGASFLEEVFGGLARDNKDVKILDWIEIKSDEEDYLKEEIKEYVKEAIAA